MLGDQMVFPILLSKDLDASRAFYNGVLGLEIMRDDPGERIVFRCGSGTQLSVTLSTVGTADMQTQLAWRVPDIHAELEDLRARGVRIESYVEPDPVTDEDGIADMATSGRPGSSTRAATPCRSSSRRRGRPLRAGSAERGHGP